MENNPVFNIFESLPRLGAGDDEHTKKAFLIISEQLKGGLKILDLGCGKGSQTMALARLCPSCEITASDIYRPYLDSVDGKIAAAGFNKRVRTLCASMDKLPFEEESFDIIWAEGCASIIGIENALNYWKKFIRPGGYIMISDIFWFTKNPSVEPQKFFAEFHPAMMSEDKGFDIVKNAGLKLAASFRLPTEVWEESFYGILRKNFGELEEKFSGNCDAMAVIEGLKRQTNLYDNYSDEFGNTYLIMRKPL
ncbi:MAG: class I SAM-dependent methyltransferase [Methanomicrobium sp.]|nr:class I SAM-dependent methyltransferase [Methanomicrobium sp.]